MGMAIATATTTEASDIPEISIAIVGIVGGLLALVLQLVQVGWFYRLGKLPLWVILSQDGLCVALVLLAFDSPKEGGTIALLLLWLAIRSSQEWYKWYLNRPRGQHPTHKPD
jgi:hypothetical protein